MPPKGAMPFLSTNLCSSPVGRCDGVLKWLRSQDDVHTCLTSSIWNQMFWNTLWVHTAFGSTLLCCMHRHFGSTLHCCMHRLRPFNVMCVLSDRHTGSACAASSNPISFSFLKLGIVCVSCFVQGTVAYSLLLCKHDSQRVVIPQFLMFLIPSLRLPFTVRFISVQGVHLHHVHTRHPPR